MVLDLDTASESPGGLLKTDFWASLPEFDPDGQLVGLENLHF